MRNAPGVAGAPSGGVMAVETARGGGVAKAGDGEKVPVAPAAGRIARARAREARRRLARRARVSLIGCPRVRRVRGPSGLRVVREVGGEPAGRLGDRETGPPRIVLELVAPHPPDPEVVRV